MEKFNIVQKNINNIFNQTLNGSGDSDRHALTLLSLVLSTKSKNILELGSRNGHSTIPLLTGAYINNGNLTSVDIKDNNIKIDEKFENNWNFINSDAIDFLNNLDKNICYDLIFIDDWHSYEHVKKELEILDKHVSCKTIILLHDLMYSTEPYYHSDLTLETGQWAQGGPYRAVAELNKNFWEFSTIPFNNGLTLLRKKYSSLYNKINI